MKRKVSVVSYLNARPFVYGLENSPIGEQIVLSEEIPSVCAAKLLSGEIDIGLVPVAALKNSDYHIFSDYCIGADGNVRSVMLFSDVPLNEIRQVMLDYQSRTSASLIKVLAREYWKINPEWIEAKPGYESGISGARAGLVIGDRTFEMQAKFPYRYDLAGEWKKFTGLPFVFAAWASREKLDRRFISEFNKALKLGLDNLEKVASHHANSSFALEYLTSSISYFFDEKKKRAMALFMRLTDA